MKPYTRRDASPLKPFVPFYPRQRPASPSCEDAVLFIFGISLLVVCVLCGAGPKW